MRERRNPLDGIRLSEFFALVCTGLMLLVLFLLSSLTHDNDSELTSINASAAPAVHTATQQNTEPDRKPE